MAEIPETTEIIQNPKSNKDMILKVISVIAVIIAITTLIIIKRQRPSFSLWAVILFSVFIVIIGLLSFFGSSIYKKYIEWKKDKEAKEELPKEASIDILFDIVKKSVANDYYRDHVKEHLGQVSHSVGRIKKNTIIDFKVRTLYGGGQLCHVVVNANYPDKTPTVLFEPSLYSLNKAINDMSLDPEEPADVEKVITQNPFTGVYQETERKTHQKKEEKKDKEDLG